MMRKIPFLVMRQRVIFPVPSFTLIRDDALPFTYVWGECFVYPFLFYAAFIPFGQVEERFGVMLVTVGWFFSVVFDSVDSPEDASASEGEDDGEIPYVNMFPYWG